MPGLADPVLWSVCASTIKALHGRTVPVSRGTRMSFLHPRHRTAAQPAAMEPSDNRSATTQPSLDSPPELRGLTLKQRLEGLPGEPFDVAWSPDGNTLAATSQGGGVAVWSEAAGQRVRLLHGHETAGVSGLAWHPTGRMLATASFDSTVRLWDLDAGTSQVLCRLDPQPYGLSWSPDGRRVAVTDEGGGLGVWDVEQAALIRHAHIHEAEVNCVRWSPDGRLVVTGSDDTTIAVSTSEDLQLVRRLSGGSDYIGDVVLSPGGDKVVGGSSGTVGVWDLHTGQQLVLLEGHTESVLCVRFSPDGEFVASGSADWTVRLWRCRDWECVAIVPNAMTNGLGGLAFHPRLPMLAVKNK